MWKSLYSIQFIKAKNFNVLIHEVFRTSFPNAQCILAFFVPFVQNILDIELSLTDAKNLTPRLNKIQLI